MTIRCYAFNFLSCPWSDRSHPNRLIRNPWSELTRSRSGWSASNPTLAKPCSSARSPLPDQPRLPQKYFIIADQAEMPNQENPKKYGIREPGAQKVSEPCPDLPIQASEVKMKPTDADHTPPSDHRSCCSLEGRSPLPDHTSRSPRRSVQANNAPIRGQLRLLSPC